jgi:hypothetical protein
MHDPEHGREYPFHRLSLPERVLSTLPPPPQQKPSSEHFDSSWRGRHGLWLWLWLQRHQERFQHSEIDFCVDW